MAKPAFNVLYRVEPTTPQGKARWLRIGAAFPMKDKTKGGYFLRLDALPINFNGQLALFPPMGDPDDSAGEKPPTPDEEAPFYG